ncbi:MAG: DUF21 domain-containing protein, partial [Aeromicrobium sp.]
MSGPAIVLAIFLVVLAGLLVAVEAAISTFSKARADELTEAGVGGAKRLVRILEDPAPYLNSVLLLRIVAETTGIVLVAAIVAD